MNHPFHEFTRYVHIAKMKLVRRFSYKNRNAHSATKEEKWAAIEKAQHQGRIKIFIETGTYRGDTVERFKNNFEKIYSVEIGQEFALAAKHRFAKYENVEIISGDSAKILPSIITNLAEPALFWLDAHCSEGDTSRGTEYSPIIYELKSILSSPLKHTVLIDDARLFDGVNYPTFRKIRRLVKNLQPTFVCEIKNDLIHIHRHD